jgi:hypothetical protein
MSIKNAEIVLKYQLDKSLTNTYNTCQFNTAKAVNRTSKPSSGAKESQDR